MCLADIDELYQKHTKEELNNVLEKIKPTIGDASQEDTVPFLLLYATEINKQ